MTEPYAELIDYKPGLTTSARMLATTLIVLGMLVGTWFYLVPPVRTGPGSGSDDGVVRVTPSDPVQKILDRAVAGSIIELQKGEYRMRLRLTEKHELTLRGVEGAVLTHSEGQPLELADRCRDVTLEKLDIRFAGAAQRTFPALILRDSQRITLIDCVLTTSGGDGLLAERVASLKITDSEIRATAWGLVASRCEQLDIRDLLVADAKRGALLSEGCSGTVAKLVSRGNRGAVQASGRGQLTLSACEFAGAKQRGVGVQIGDKATVAIEGGTSIEGFEKGVLVKDGGTLLGKGFAVKGNRYVGVHVEERAQMVRLLELTTTGQQRPLDIDRRTIPDHWEISPDLLPK